MLKAVLTANPTISERASELTTLVDRYRVDAEGAPRPAALSSYGDNDLN